MRSTLSRRNRLKLFRLVIIGVMLILVSVVLAVNLAEVRAQATYQTPTLQHSSQPFSSFISKTTNGPATSQYYSPSFQTFNSERGLNYGSFWPGLGVSDSLCTARQDFVLEILPGSCSPSVVRSDLLESQNVPVFCPVTAVKINPMVDIGEIQSVSFAGVSSPAADASVQFDRGGISVNKKINDYIYGEEKRKNWVKITDIKDSEVILQAQITNENNESKTATYSMKSGQQIGAIEGLNISNIQKQENLKLIKINPRMPAGSPIPESVAGISFYPYRAATATKDNLFASPGPANIGSNLGYVVVVLKQIPKEADMPESVVFNLTANLKYDVKKVFGAGRSEFFLQDLEDEKWKADYKEYGFFKGNAYLRLDELAVDGQAARVSIYKDVDTKVNTLNLKLGEQSQIVYLPGFYCSAGVRVKFMEAEAPKQKIKLRVDDDYLWLYEGGKFLNEQCVVRSIQITERAKNNGLEKAVAKISCPKKSFDLEINELDQSLGTKDLRWEDVLKDVEPAKAKKIIDNFALAKENAFLVVDLYTSEKKETGEYYGLAELQDVAQIALQLGQFKMEAEIHEKIISKYPGTSAALVAEQRLAQLKKYSYERANSLVSVNFAVHSVSMIDYRYPAASDASVVFNRPVNEERRIGDYIYFRDSDNDGKANETDEAWARIREIKIDSIILQTKVTEVNAATGQKSTRTGNYVMKEGQTLGSMEGLNIPGLTAGENVKLEKINLKAEIKVEIVPEVPRAGTTGNFTFGVGIEKRSLKISPDKTEEMIKNINESIERWSGITKNLGEAVKAGKAMCLAGSTALFVKNFIANTGGGASARTEVMRGPGGWFDQCTKEVNEGLNKDKYATVDGCLLKHNDDIEKEVQRQKEAEERVNGNFEAVYDENDIKGSQQKFISQFADDVCDGSLKGRKAEVMPGNSKIICGDGGIFTSKEAIIDAYNRGAFTISDAKKIMTASQTYGGGDLTINNQELGGQRLNGFFSNMYSRPEPSVSGFAKLLGDSGGKVYSAYSPDTRPAELEVIEVKERKIGNISGLDNGRYALLAVSPSSSAVLPDRSKDLAGKLMLIPVTTPDVKGNIALDAVNSQRMITVDVSGSKTGFNQDNYNDVLAASKISTLKAIPATQVECSNYYREPKVKYFTSGQFAGLPAVVPIDDQRGWYVAMKDSELAPYTEAGQLRTFWVCNVGRNGLEEFDIDADDKSTCFQINLDRGTPLDQSYCFSKEETTRMINRAQQAIQQAGKYDQGRSKVSILGSTYDVARIASSAVGTQCQDFMSAKDCNIMFNLCDPVLCPSSRCDLGGAYRVDDVVQSGIVGSIALCLPNAKEGIYVPVCLTGVYAGLDAYTSVLKSHRDCLQESLNTGQYVGLCDEVRSIYMCEFFWRQAAPLAKAGIPKLIEGLTGSGSARAGGEYSNFQKAWSTADKSFNYFTQVYGQNAFAAFKARSTADIGSEVCKSFVSANYPNSGDLFDALLKPESPVQFYAEFDEIPYSEATVPPTSQYNVFYHIYAGRDKGTYFTIYLKNPPQSGLYSSQDRINVRQGFVPLGQYDSQKVEFTAPSGYKELCVNINGKDECGFEKVSTDYLVQRAADEYAREQATNVNIQTEEQCINGDSSIYSAIDFNIEDAASGVLNPEMYKRGIIRVCSAQNPGQNAGPSSGAESTKWRDVGYCDEQRRIRCWLDTNTVKDVIKDKNIEGKTLGEISLELAQQSPAQVQASIDGVEGEVFVNGKNELKKELSDNEVQAILDKLTLIEQQQAASSPSYIKVQAADMKYKVHASIVKQTYLSEQDRIETNVNKQAAKTLADARKDCTITGYAVPSGIKTGQKIPAKIKFRGECKYWNKININMMQKFSDYNTQVSGYEDSITAEEARARESYVNLPSLSDAGKYYLDLELYYLETGEGRGNQKFSEEYSGKDKAGQEFIVTKGEGVADQPDNSVQDCEVTAYNVLREVAIDKEYDMLIGIQGPCSNWDRLSIEAIPTDPDNKIGVNYNPITINEEDKKDGTVNVEKLKPLAEGEYYFKIYPINKDLSSISRSKAYMGGMEEFEKIKFVAASQSTQSSSGTLTQTFIQDCKIKSYNIPQRATPGQSVDVIVNIEGPCVASDKVALSFYKIDYPKDVLFATVSHEISAEEAGLGKFTISFDTPTVLGYQDSFYYIDADLLLRDSSRNLYEQEALRARKSGPFIEVGLALGPTAIKPSDSQESARKAYMKKETTRWVSEARDSLYPILILRYDPRDFFSTESSDYFAFRWNANLEVVQSIVMTNVIGSFDGEESEEWINSATSLSKDFIDDMSSIEVEVIRDIFSAKSELEMIRKILKSYGFNDEFPEVVFYNPNRELYDKAFYRVIFFDLYDTDYPFLTEGKHFDKKYDSLLTESEARRIFCDMKRQFKIQDKSGLCLEQGATGDVNQNPR